MSGWQSFRVSGKHSSLAPADNSFRTDRSASKTNWKNIYMQSISTTACYQGDERFWLPEVTNKKNNTKETEVKDKPVPLVDLQKLSKIGRDEALWLTWCLQPTQQRIHLTPTTTERSQRGLPVLKHVSYWMRLRKYKGLIELWKYGVFTILYDTRVYN